MKTADGIRKGLEVCPSHNDCTGICPYEGTNMCRRFLMKDALAYIQQLESLLAQAERERDAAVRDMSKAVRENGVCIACKHDKPFDNNCEENDFDCVNCISPCMCKSCHIGSNYEWRGPCPENTQDPAKE